MSAVRVKKLINTVEHCVDDNLDGHVALNPGVRLLEGHRIVIRADFEEAYQDGKVAVVCGGGSGHEPAFSGYVGKGMLTTAVMGSVFASPPSSEVLTALRAVGRHNPSGCVFVIPNYTGDRLNFGLAVERAQGEGIRIATVIVGEDCALSTSDKSAGRRGISGIPIACKIAGALAEEGRGADEIVDIVSKALANMATIGVALSPCTVPGSGPTFQLPDDEMELGLGVHGEAGVRRLKVLTAKETVQIMLDHMTSPSNENRLSLQKGERVAVFINDLGGISQMELNIVAKEAIASLESRGVSVVRAYRSPFISSLEMAGTHITVLRLDDVITRCLDAPTDAPHWPRPLLAPGMTDRTTLPPLVLDYVHVDLAEVTQGGVVLDADMSMRLHAMLTASCKALVAQELRLNSLDSGCGDGDCGSTLARGAKNVLEELGSVDSPGLPVSRPAALCRRVAAIADAHMGGASGGLYGLLFTGASTYFASSSSSKGVETWTQALRQGISMMTRYGGAEPGDRTMLDALCPVLKTLTSAGDMPVSQLFEGAVQAAEKGAEGTAGMKARAGRASYVSTSLLQQPDPGAVGVAVWLRAACEAFAQCVSTR